MGQRPPVAADSEVYKMLQDNQESDEPPRQSASFRVLQEILETGTDPGFMGYVKSFFVELKCYWNTVSTVFCRRL